jgi:hypothetical protein
MRLLLRVIATWNGLSVLVTMLLLAHLVGRAASAITWLLLIGLVVTIPLGVYGTVQLWRLRHKGRYATLVLFGLWGALMLTGIATGQRPSTSEALRLGVVVLLGCVLLSPAARRTCS